MGTWNYIYWFFPIKWCYIGNLWPWHILYCSYKLGFWRFFFNIQESFNTLQAWLPLLLNLAFEVVYTKTQESKADPYSASLTTIATELIKTKRALTITYLYIIIPTVSLWFQIKVSKCQSYFTTSRCRYRPKTFSVMIIWQRIVRRHKTTSRRGKISPTTYN